MSPILTIQRRLREIGRLRIGQQVETTIKSGPKAGQKGTRPEKLDRFRFTSRDRQVIDAAAARFGGTVAPWTAPDGDQWEVVTDARELPILVPPGDGGFSQWYELWSAGGCQRRCDGVRMVSGRADQPCLCDEEDPENRACSPHTRLSVIIRGLEGLGVWRLESQGYYAATELAGAAEVCAAASAAGHMIPARLRVEARSVKRPKKNGSGIETLRFMVPALDVDVPVESLGVLAASAPTPIEVASGEVVELPAGGGGFRPIAVAELAAGPEPSIAEQLQVAAPVRAPRANAAQPIPATGVRPRTAAAAGSGGGGEDSPPHNAATARAGTAAAPAGNACSRCGQSLAGSKPVKGGQGESRWVHETCPSSGGGGEVAPGSDTTPASDPEPDPETERKKALRACHAEAKKAFPDIDSLDSKANKEERDARRHAVVRNVTGGRTGSLTECSDEELVKVRSWLRDVTEGRVAVVPAEGDDPTWPDGWAVELAARVPDEAA